MRAKKKANYLWVLEIMFCGRWEPRMDSITRHRSSTESYKRLRVKQDKEMIGHSRKYRIVRYVARSAR